MAAVLPTLGTLAQPLPGSSGSDAGNAPGAGGTSMAPSPAPASPAAPEPATPSQSAAGDTALARSHVALALNLLNSAIGKLPPGSPEHKIVMEVTRRLAKQFAGNGQADTLSASNAGLLAAQAQQAGSAPLNPQVQ